MQIYEVTDTRFRKYGKVIRNIDFSALSEAMKKTAGSIRCSLRAVDRRIRGIAGGKGD